MNLASTCVKGPIASAVSELERNGETIAPPLEAGLSVNPDNVEDATYALRREAEERAAARAATDPAICDTHFMMAERYADHAMSIPEG